jgi:hypothetical protein
VAELRAAGFPPNIVRAIVTAQLTAIFAERRRALDPEAGRRPFWKNQPPDAKLQTALRQLDFEQQKMLRRLLGDDAESDDLWSRRQQRNAWSTELPADKAAEVKRLREHFDEQRYDVFVASLAPADSRAKLAALEHEQHEAVAKILSPQELEAYDLRTSSTASSLRARMGAFEATEQEFRSLYQLQRSFDERFAALRLTVTPTEEQSHERTEAQKQLTEQFKAVLGPQRYAEYERASDSSYQQAVRLVARLELPSTAANEVWSVQKAIQESATTIRENRALTDAQRNTQLAALAADASARITRTLGPRGFDAYKDNGGWWLAELTTPRPGR